MKLRDYLFKKRIRNRDFAKKIGVSDATVSSAVYERFTVSLPTAMKIVEVTDGEVDFKDLLVEKGKDDDDINIK